MTYEGTMEWLYNRLPMFHRIGPSAYKPDSEALHTLDCYFNHQHKNYKTIHVAGTNGKGSVSHYLAATFQQNGYRTGLFTSPHLRDFRERARINGEMMPKEFVVNFVNQHHEYFENMASSFFVVSTMMAFNYFAHEHVDFAIIEVGLGGQRDSTNLIHPELSVITNVSLDHIHILGPTLPQIAQAKAGIIKTNVPVVIGESHPETKSVFLNKALANNAPISFADEHYKAEPLTSQREKLECQCQSFKLFRDNQLYLDRVDTDLLGNYQAQNLCTVFQALEILNKKIPLDLSATKQALGNTAKLTNLMGRWQILGRAPLTISDTAHNAAGLEQVINQLSNTPHNKLHMVLGMVKDKDISNMFALLPTEATYYFTRADIPRAADQSELLKTADQFGLNGRAYPSVKLALEAARSQAADNDIIFIGGSTFVVAEVV